jgi:SAM-dependent methyltransferase
MAQVETGIRRILNSATVYERFEDLVGARRLRRRVVREFIRPQMGDRILDLGCGPAGILDELPLGIDYCGFDASAKYIAFARRKYGDRGQFWVEQMSQARLNDPPEFDVVLASAVLHHLDDEEASTLFHLAHQALRPGGRLITYDACYTDDQSRASRFIVGRDRGQFVRRPEGYVELAAGVFPLVEPSVFSGHLRIPYTAIVLTCRKD